MPQISLYFYIIGIFPISQAKNRIFFHNIYALKMAIAKENIVQNLCTNKHI